MPHDPRKILHDMKQAAERISRFIAGKTYEHYVADDLLRSAVERQFEIIGEAMIRLRKLAPDLAARISNHEKIAGFRNILIHDYDGVDDAITWNAIQKHVPILQGEVEAMLPSLP
jgi:uncharacterized protein with HEPN domain